MHLSFSTTATPIGTALGVRSDRGLRTLDFVTDDAIDAVTVLSGDRTPIVRDDAALADVFTQLDEYFAGERRAFDLPLDLTGIEGFVRATLETILEIPYGETASYGEVAVLAGRPRAARAVGTTCARTPISVVIPVHRVVRADGSIGEYGGRPEAKRFLLDLEAAA